MIFFRLGLLFLFPSFFLSGIPSEVSAASNSQKVDFLCPYGCGQWGSESIKDLEWQFVNCLYDAAVLSDYIRFNLYKRNGCVSSSSAEQRYKRFIPAEVEFFYPRPLNFSSEWYQNILGKEDGPDGKITIGYTKRFVVLGNDDVRKLRGDYQCNNWQDVNIDASSNKHATKQRLQFNLEDYSCLLAFWDINHKNDWQNNHLGKFFIRLVNSAYVDLDPWNDHDIDEDENTYVFESKDVFSFGNFIDFHHACLALRNDVCMEKDADKYRNYAASPIFERAIHERASKVLSAIDLLPDQYHNIFSKCVKEHKAPSAIYNLALFEMSEGFYADGLDHLVWMLDTVNIESLERNLASQIYQTKGEMEVEVGAFDEAILSLSQAIERNPDNEDAYLERAVAYFEKGDIDQAIKDYLLADPVLNSKAFEDDLGLYFMTLAIPGGAIKGLTDASKDFIPSAYESIKGVGHILWASVKDPLNAPLHLGVAVRDFIELLKDCDKAELAQIAVPELYELLTEWDKFSGNEKGDKIGYFIGKYGTDIFLNIAIFKGVNYIQKYNNIKKASKIATMEALAKSKESRKSVTQSAAKFKGEREALLLKSAVPGPLAFTRDNFRKNLMKLTGKIQPIHIQAHHVFPQSLKRIF